MDTINLRIIGILCFALLPLLTLCNQRQDSIIQKLEASDGLERSELLNHLSAEICTKNPDKAIELATEALEIAVSLKDLNLQADAYFNIAQGYRSKGENVRSLDYYIKAEKVYKEIDLPMGVAKSSDNSGKIYRFMGDYSTALDHHLKALNIYESLNYDQGIAEALINAGVAYRNLGKSDLALDYYNKAIEKGKLSGDHTVLVNAMISKGNVYWYEGENNKALFHYEEALHIIELHPEELFDRAGIINNIGNVYRQKGEYKKALNQYEHSLQLSRKVGDKNMIAVIYKNIGITHKYSGQYALAIQYLGESKSMAEQIRLAAVHLETLNELSQTYSMMGDYKSALDFYQQFSELKESMAKEQASNKMSLMQLGYHLKDESQRQTIREVDLNLEILRERNIRNIIVFITLLAVSLIFILWSRYKLKMRTNLELKQLNTDLEKRVEERTKRLREENERRKIAQELAEQANETKNRFLANISHEVRTPINAIIGFCDLTIKSGIEERHLLNLKRIKDSTQHLLALIKDVLDYSQIDYGKTELKRTSFNLKEIMDSVINAFFLDARSKKIDIKLDISNKVPSTLIGDKDAIRQIMYNLIGNAIKFTEQGSVNVSIKPADEHQSKDQVKLLFSVRDSGIGISKMKQKLIFMDFTQEHTDASRKYGGAGLGLTISKHFVELMDGNIWVESEKGKGSNFMFTIMLKCDHSKQDVKKNKDMITEKKLHVLIAEDNLLNAQVITAFLNRLGHSSAVAVNGLEAIKELASKDFDAVLMDIEMPEMDGLEATRVIRKGKEKVRNPQIPIVALTAHALKDYEDKSYQAGMNNYLTKPIDIEQLSSVLQTL
ncbi:MAG: tetratricopeptide repeat protein [Bacteroidetes bacterium]|nr:tetratricopeptide repeat protein [Bacteroidota bacterium]